VNVNSDGHLKANVNQLSNDNVWNVEYRHRLVIPQHTVSPTLLWWEFCFETFLPSTKHPTNFLEFDGKSRIFFSINQLILPTNLEKEFEEIKLADSSDQILELVLCLGILSSEQNLENIEKEFINLATKRMTMDFRDMRNDTIPESVGSFEFLNEWQNCGGGYSGKYAT